MLLLMMIALMAHAMAFVDITYINWSEAIGAMKENGPVRAIETPKPAVLWLAPHRCREAGQPRPPLGPSPGANRTGPGCCLRRRRGPRKPSRPAGIRIMAFPGP